MQDDEKYKKIKEELDRLHKQKQNSKENSKNNLNNQSNSQNNINQNSNNSDKNSNSNKNSYSSNFANKRDYDKEPLIIQSYEEFFVLIMFMASLILSLIISCFCKDLYKGSVIDFDGYIAALFFVSWIYFCRNYLSKTIFFKS